MSQVIHRKPFTNICDILLNCTIAIITTFNNFSWRQERKVTISGFSMMKVSLSVVIFNLVVCQKFQVQLSCGRLVLVPEVAVAFRRERDISSFSWFSFSLTLVLLSLFIYSFFLFHRKMYLHFYLRPVLTSGYCRCLRLCARVYQSLACLLDNLGPVQARITKFGPKMQNFLIKVPIVLEVIDIDLQGKI